MLTRLSPSPLGISTVSLDICLLGWKRPTKFLLELLSEKPFVPVLSGNKHSGAVGRCLARVAPSLSCTKVLDLP